MLLSRAPAHWGGGTGITKSTQFNIVVKPAWTAPSFSTATDAEILEVVQKLDSGEITVEQVGWQVGDARNVNLSSFKTYSTGSASTTATVATQTAQLVIQNIGGKTFKGNGTSLDNTECHYVVGFKDNVCQTYWGSSSTSVIYSTSLIQQVETNIYNALPSTIKSCFKKWECVTGTYNGSTSGGSNNIQNRYFASPAAKELFGTSSGSTSNEANALTQFDYYKTTNNRKHTKVNSWWWTRSVDAQKVSDILYVGCVSKDGTSSGDYPCWDSAGGLDAVSPFGCI